jgi:hypothetical protein
VRRGRGSMREDDVCVCVCTMDYRVVDVAKILILGAFFFAVDHK